MGLGSRQDVSPWRTIRKRLNEDEDQDARRPLPGVNNRMMDIVYTALTAGLLALTWGLVRLCERVA